MDLIQILSLGGVLGLSFFLHFYLFRKYYNINISSISNSDLSKFIGLVLLFILFGNFLFDFGQQFFGAISFSSGINILVLLGIIFEEYLKSRIYWYFATEKFKDDKKIKRVQYGVLYTIAFALIFGLVESALYLSLAKDSGIINYWVFLGFRAIFNPLAHIYFVLQYCKYNAIEDNGSKGLMYAVFFHLLFNTSLLFGVKYNFIYISLGFNLLLLGYLIKNTDFFLKPIFFKKD